MSEYVDPQLEGNFEKNQKARFLAYSLGGTALTLAAGITMSRLPGVRTAARDIVDHIDRDKRESRPYTVELLAATARSFGVPLEKSHIDYWQTMEAAYLAIDDIIDESQPESIEFEALALICGQPIPGLARTEAQNFSAIIHSASEERKNIILGGLQAQAIAEELRFTTDVKEMLNAREKESIILTRIMTLENPHNNANINRFNEWMFSAGISAYQTDSLRDLAKDFKHGVSAVRPSLTNHFIAAKEAARTTFHTLRHLPLSAFPSLATIGAKRAISHTLAKILSNEAS